MPFHSPLPMSTLRFLSSLYATSTLPPKTQRQKKDNHPVPAKGPIPSMPSPPPAVASPSPSLPCPPCPSTPLSPSLPFVSSLPSTPLALCRTAYVEISCRWCVRIASWNAGSPCTVSGLSPSQCSGASVMLSAFHIRKHIRMCVCVCVLVYIRKILLPLAPGIQQLAHYLWLLEYSSLRQMRLHRHGLLATLEM